MAKILTDIFDRPVSILLAKQNFWEYCKTLYPSFYSEDRPYLRELAETLEFLYRGELLNEKTGRPYRKLMINMPPRFGKSFTLTNFTEWCLGIRNENRIITICYNEILSGIFSKKVRDTIESSKVDDHLLVFNDIFPDTKIRYGDASMSLWSLEGQHFNYLGGSFNGTITGMGCNIGIIDDPVKNKKEAFNAQVLEGHYSFYTDTFLSRLEEGSIQIINMTRWAEKDLCGRILEEEADEWYVIKMEAIEEGEMLCEDLMSRETYEERKRQTSEDIFQANYHQKTMDKKGAMYGSFKLYSELPIGMKKNYTDTADEGDDYLCSICYNEVHVGTQKFAYVTDIYYTQDGMEITESKTAAMLMANGTAMAKVESNNGGKGFARNVKTLMSGKGSCSVTWFHQSQNKKARIFSNSHSVQTNVLFPSDWATRWPGFYEALTTYKREGKNKHDDAPDAITGVVEDVVTSVRTYRPKSYTAEGRA